MRFTNVEIAKKTYPLRFTNNAICDLEERAGMGLDDLFSKGMAMSAIRLMVWAGLSHKFPTLTVEKTGDLLDQHLEGGGTLAGIMPVLMQALIANGIIQKPAPKAKSAVEVLDLEGPLEAKALDAELAEAPVAGEVIDSEETASDPEAELAP